jgi:hypothetical protein
MRRIYAPLTVLGWAAVIGFASRATADNNFFNVTATGSGGTTVFVQGSNIIHLTNNLFDLSDGFAPLAGQNVSASLSWGGVPNALLFSENASQSSATLTIPSTGFTKTFTASSESDLQSQIKDFIKSDGDGAYAAFLEQMDEHSPGAALDGNPQASTAIVADSVFNQFGLYNELSTEPRNGHNSFEIGGNVEGAATSGDNLNGGWAAIDINTAWRFLDNVALAFGTTLDSTEIAGAWSYTIAEDIGLPISILMNQGDGLSWQVTPWYYAALSSSYDQASGSVLMGGGGTSSLALHIANFTLTLGDQIGYNGDIPVDVDGYALDAVINQWILKNGVDGNYRIPYTPIFLDLSLAYSDFLRRAAVSDYWSPSGGVGVKFGPASGMRLAYIGDFGPRYNSSGGELSFYVNY